DRWHYPVRQVCAGQRRPIHRPGRHVAGARHPRPPARRDPGPRNAAGHRRRRGDGRRHRRTVRSRLAGGTAPRRAIGADRRVGRAGDRGVIRIAAHRAIAAEAIRTEIRTHARRHPAAAAGQPRMRVRAVLRRLRRGGRGLVLLAHFLLPGATQDDLLLIAAFSLAWVVGFVTPGAPGGLGVREALLLLMLAPAYSAASASILVIALR